MSDVLWKDLITIPDRPSDGDFVHKLTEVVNNAEATSSTYVVTKGLRAAFEQAVGLVAKAIKTGGSEAAFLHGSFGAGKSHFMAMLHLILSGSEVVTRRDEFFELFEKYGEFRSDGKKVLNVHLHMLNAHTTESAIFAGYMNRVRTLHPDAPMPDLLGMEPIVRNGVTLRSSMGDETFFAALSTAPASTSTSKFGRANQAQGIAPSSVWDAARFDAALAGGPGTEEYNALGRQLTRTVFTSMADLASRATHAGDNTWVDLGQGLVAMSQHAQSLGYDAIVLFLDEHILWLAGMLGDAKRVGIEIPKLSLLVETNAGTRAVPIVSFVAQQYELVNFRDNSKALYGSDLARIDRQIKHDKTRLSTIHLPGSDLPQIVQKRLLDPTGSEAERARATIRQAYDLFLQKLDPGDRSLMTMGTVDADTMRMTWPFSPVLVQALVRLSEKLQRDRTALKLLTLLLCRHRDDLVLGKVVPMGDLWLELINGDEPMDYTSKAVFHRARSLYENKLRPALLERHSLVADDLDDPHPGDDVRPRINAFRRDDLLVCTVLVASLLPDWEVTQSLDLQKLYAYNWGAVGGGRFAGMGLTVVKETMEYLTHRCDEVVLLPATEPGQAERVRLRLEGVDLGPILREAERYASKQRLEGVTRRLVFTAMGHKDAAGNTITHKINWRGAERRLTVLFENVRAVADDRDDVFMTTGDEFKLILDYPFDDPGFSAKADVDRLHTFQQRHPSDCNTLVWLPRFLSNSGYRLLKDFVVAEAAVEFFGTLTSNLDDASRKQAGALLAARVSQLSGQTLTVLAAAFDLLRDRHEEQLSSDHVDVEVFNPLHRSMKVPPPASADFGRALEYLATTMLGTMFPAAPERLRSAPVKSAAERTRLAECLVQGFSTGEPSFAVNKDQVALLREVAQPLGMGELHESALRFTIANTFEEPLRRARADAGDSVTVQTLRNALDPSTARTGLPVELCDLMIVCWALRNAMDFYDGTTHVDDIENRAMALSPSMRLLQTALPDEAVWQQALANATQVFGIAANAFPYRTPRNMRRLAEKVTERIAENQAVLRLPSLIQTVAEGIGEPVNDPKRAIRYRHARDTCDLVEKLHRLNDHELVVELGRARPENPALLKAIFDKAEAFAAALEDIEPMKDVYTACLAQEDSEAAREIHAAFVRQLLTAGPHDFSGVDVRTIQRNAKEWLRQRSTSGPLPPPPPQPDPRVQVDEALAEDELPEPLRGAQQATTAGVESITDIGAPTTAELPAAGVRRRRVRTSSELDELLGQLKQALQSGRTIVIDWSIDEDDA